MMESDQNDIRRLVFRYRSYTPLPFLILMIVFAEPTMGSMIGGGILVAAGEAVRFWGVSIAGSETRTTGGVGGTFLITNGPFAYVRNPLYVGNMLVYAGVGVMSMALFPWLIVAALIFFLFQYSLIISKEEEYLERQFGEDYARYRAHVPRFVPRLRAYQSPAPPAKTVNPREGLASERRTLQAIGLVVLAIVVIYAVRMSQG